MGELNFVWNSHVPYFVLHLYDYTSTRVLIQRLRWWIRIFCMYDSAVLLSSYSGSATWVWISSLMERLASCFFFTASSSTRGLMVMPCNRDGRNKTSLTVDTSWNTGRAEEDRQLGADTSLFLPMNQPSRAACNLSQQPCCGCCQSLAHCGGGIGGGGHSRSQISALKN